VICRIIGLSCWAQVVVVILPENSNRIFLIVKVCLPACNSNVGDFERIFGKNNWVV